MILYDIRCSNGHVFEGWFKDGASYDEQAEAGAVVCPFCGDTAVAKAPMAPRIASGRGGDGKEGGAVTMPAEVREALVKLRGEVESKCDYVGEEFAEEARKIHYGETGKRDIYGEATDDEAKELTEEGIKVGKIPWIPRTDS
jgi:hypothetical protein